MSSRAITGPLKTPTASPARAGTFTWAAAASRAQKQESSLLWPVCFPQEDTAPADARFSVAGATVRDTLTGLVWSLDAFPAGRPLPWQEALRLIDELNKAPQGPDDWRMPNIRELESLVDLSADSPALPAGHPFLNVRDVYWSSTTSLYEPRYAWALYAQDGIVGVGFKPDAGFHLWPVRGG